MAPADTPLGLMLRRLPTPASPLSRLICKNAIDCALQGGQEMDSAIRNSLRRHSVCGVSALVVRDVGFPGLL